MVTVMPTTAASRNTRHTRPSRAGLRTRVKAIATTNTLAWMVK